MGTIRVSGFCTGLREAGIFQTMTEYDNPSHCVSCLSPPSSIPPTHIRHKLSGLNIARHIASSPQMACVAQDDTIDDEPEPTQEPTEEM